MTSRRSENPLTKEFWIGDADARVLALFRILLGSTVLFDVVDRLRDFTFFYTDSGFAPRGAFLENMARVWRFSLMDTVGRPSLCLGFVLCGTLATLAFTVGYRTRIASIAHWLFVLSLHERNWIILDGGDTLIRVVSFWAMWADLGAAWSVDVWRARRPAQKWVSAYPLRILQVQVVLIYVMAAVLKSGSQWHDGTAVYHAMQLDEFARPFGQHLLAAPWLCTFITWSTLAIEGSFVFLIYCPFFNRWTRGLAVFSCFTMHVGIFVTMRIGLFNLVMPTVLTLFLLPEWIDWFERRAKLKKIPDQSNAPRCELKLPAKIFLAVQIVGVILVQANSVLPQQPHIGSITFGTVPKLPLPQFVPNQLSLFGQWQYWDMFSPNPLVDNSRWTGPATLTDGRQIDILHDAMPEMETERGFYYTRWVKLRTELQRNNQGALRLFSGYLCRTYNTSHTPKLDKFEFVIHGVRTHGPGEAEASSRDTSIWHWQCGSKAPN